MFSNNGRNLSWRCRCAVARPVKPVRCTITPLQVSQPIEPDQNLKLTKMEEVELCHHLLFLCNSISCLLALVNVLSEVEVMDLKSNLLAGTQHQTIAHEWVRHSHV
jgi:hypothetical protein